MSSYTVFFNAKLRKGFKYSDAVRTLGEVFSLDTSQVESLLKSAPRSVKRGAAKTEANKIIKALWQAGWHSELYLNDVKVYSTEKAQARTAEVVEPGLQTQSLSSQEFYGSDQNSQPIKSERLLRLTANDQTCSICIPEYWKAINQLNSNACLQAGCTNSDCYLVIIPQVKSAINRQVSLQEYTEAVMVSAIGCTEMGSVTSPATPQKLAGISAVVGEVESVLGDNRVRYLISVYEGKDSFFACYLWSDVKEYKRQKPLLDALLTSFRVK